mmetsp:Transcript_107361/g.256465  ORF Transcript_107361/g.256465 Transcript_107361/m.256465 type:complete len:236 (-) Transcript_107361:589-1296(-)
MYSIHSLTGRSVTMALYQSIPPEIAWYKVSMVRGSEPKYCRSSAWGLMVSRYSMESCMKTTPKRKFTNSSSSRAQHRDLAEPMTPFTMTRSSEKKRTTRTMRRIRARRTMRRIFRPDSWDSVVQTSTSTSSTKARSTRTVSKAFQWMEEFRRVQKYSPSTAKRKHSSMVKRPLKTELKMRKTRGGVLPMFTMLQCASTPIKMAQSKISVAQDHSNFGLPTINLATLRHLPTSEEL